jgi:hypothetical protein
MRPFLPRGLTPLPSLRALTTLLSGRRAEEPLLLTCYGKADCSLCDKAKVPVARIVRSSGGRIAAEWVDIERDPALWARWGERIPVICAGETVLAEGKVSEVWLRRALAAHARPRPD